MGRPRTSEPIGRTDLRPDIVISMAVRCDGVSYYPLGIHKNPLYSAYRALPQDPNDKKLLPYGGISPFFHAVTANFVQELNPNIRVATISPLYKMKKRG